MERPQYEFTPMTQSDLPEVRRWLDTPEVVRWWGDPDQQFVLIREDLDHPAMSQFIVTHHGQKFGYLQSYDLTSWPNSEFGVQPSGARAIDQFIGDPDMINRGHGSAFIRVFVAGMLATGKPRIITDPNPENARAIRAYEKAGF